MLLHAQYVRRKLINDVADTPFSFLFDETTNSQVKKQCGGYVVYWPKQYCRVVHRYCGSFFVGHCDVDALVNHYLDFVKASSSSSKKDKTVSLNVDNFFQDLPFSNAQSSARYTKLHWPP